MFQQITIIGRLGQDPDVRMTASGVPVASLSVGVSEKWTGKDGKKEERTDWFRVTAWNKLADICGKYLKKGALVMFVGKMQQETYEKDGQKQYSWKLIASEMKMLGGDKKEQGAQAPASNYSSGYGDYGNAGYASPRGAAEEDVPF